MASTDFCRHFPRLGLLNHTVCVVGVDMLAMRDETVRPFRLPCIHPDAHHLCLKYEGYTAEEIAESDRQMREALRAMDALMTRTSEECPHCGAHVERLEQAERCVYSRPCGCRQYQGAVPTAWKTGES